MHVPFSVVFFMSLFADIAFVRASAGLFEPLPRPNHSPLLRTATLLLFAVDRISSHSNLHGDPSVFRFAGRSPLLELEYHESAQGVTQRELLSVTKFPCISDNNEDIPPCPRKKDRPFYVTLRLPRKPLRFLYFSRSSFILIIVVPPETLATSPGYGSKIPELPPPPLGAQELWASVLRISSF